MDKKTQQSGTITGNELFNQIPVGFVVLDEQGRILAVNCLLKKQLAISGDSLLKECLADYVVTSDRPLLANHLSQLRAVRAAEPCRLRLAQSGGTIVWVRLESLVTNDELVKP